MATDTVATPWLHVAEAAKYCRCGQQVIRSAVQTGIIPSFCAPGAERTGAYLVNVRDLDSFVRLKPMEWPVARCLHLPSPESCPR